METNPDILLLIRKNKGLARWRQARPFRSASRSTITELI